MTIHPRAAATTILVAVLAAPATYARSAAPAEAFTLPLAATLAIQAPESTDTASAVDPSAALPPIEAFGAKGTWHWSVGAGVAWNSEATDSNIYFTAHTFITQDFEFNLTLGGWYFSQDGPDAGGINPAFGFRWHFMNRETWSLYGEVGIGLLLSNDDVPDGGSTSNFTPRAGVGATIDLDGAAGGPRLDVGLRWHHISNASSGGASNNPSRDSVMLYAGVMFPF